jgi:hypothetical protein
MLPTLARIRVEDLPKEVRSAFAPAFSVLNLFMSSVAQALNKHLAVDENFLGFSLSLTARYSTDFPVRFDNKLKVLPKHVLLTRTVKVDPTTGEELTPIAATIAWRVLDTGQLEISSPSGLSSGETYKLQFLVLG